MTDTDWIGDDQNAFDIVLKQLQQLDGTTKTAVKLMTGYTEEELELLGGFDCE